MSSRPATRRMARRQSGRSVAVIVGVALVTVGCGGSPTESEESDSGSRDGGVLNVAHDVAVSSLDPDIGNAGSDHHVLYNIYDTLFEYTNEDLVVEPGLVEEWEYRDDTTLEFTLRHGVEFSDGAPFDAEAVKYNIDRSMNLDESNVVSDVAVIDEVEVVDDHTVVIHLSEASSSILLALADRAGMMISPTAAEELGEDFEHSPVGTGPYVVEEYLTDERVTLERNPDHWREGLPHLDGMEFHILTDLEARASAFATGEVDFLTNATAQDVERFESEPGVVMTANPTVYVNMLYLNWGMPPLDDKRVRQAFQHGIDREAIFEGIYDGLGEIAWNGPIPPTHWAAGESSDIRYPYDPDQAHELLEEAGYTPGEAEVDIQTRTDSEYQRLGQLIEEQLEEAGFTVNLHVIDRSVSSERMFLDKEWHASTSAWTGRPDPDTTFRALFMPDAYFNAAESTPDGIVDMITEGSQYLELDDRADVYGPLLDRLAEEALSAPLRWAPSGDLYRDHVQGYEPSLLGKPKFTEVWLDE